ncbi:TRAP transporter large permease subunit [Albimonas pacifica]|uniref:TRAP transporter, DctM subunit n=1 Tax=Albimonas pacifica TaxID=1114924 RepID=A0A1I3FB98_9RHOB|nr:TRAP transporter large permease subunit [Albimonas pacifica]SFI08454.1 TRAP transporter, DctM subunit [Albimonas pacifica]
MTLAATEDGRTAGGVSRPAALAVSVLATLAVMLLMAHTLANVTMRYVFNMPLQGASEIAGAWYMPLIAFSGFVLAQAGDRHIAANILFDQLPPRLRREVAVGGAGLCAAICALFAWFSFGEAMHGREIGRMVIAGSFELIVWPATFAAPAAFAALTAMLAWKTVALLAAPAEAISPAALGEADGPDGRAAAGRGVWLGRFAIVALLGVAVGGVLLSESRTAAALSALGLLLILLFLHVPVAFALAVPGLLGLWAIRPRSVETMLADKPYEATATWTLSVLPMFVFMGLLLWKSGLTTRIYEAARQWLAWLPGGLAVSTNMAGTGLAAVSGSTLGTTYALSRIGIPEMLARGYDRRLAVGSVMVAGLPGQLIPPSTFLVVYAGIAEVPIGPQLMAGVGPGLLISAVFSLAMVLFALASPGAVGRGTGAAEPVDWAERWRALGRIWPLPALIAVVLGGMYSGVLTATEAGAAGAAGALLLTLVLLGRGAPRAIVGAGVETVIVTGSIFLLIVGAEILSSMLTLSGLTRGFAAWVGAMEFGRIEFLLIVMVAYLVMGMFMDPLPMMLLTVPLLIPILNGMEVSLLWFGVFTVFMAELGILTPPVGILSFVMHSILQDRAVNAGQRISLGDVFVSVALFLPIAVVAAVLLILFPTVATWLPDSMMLR